MDYEFIAKIAYELERAGYLNDRDPFLPDGQSLIYARTPYRYRIGFAKVEDHLLFVDWENTLFGQLDRLVEVYRSFRAFVNQGFRTPPALRVQIPNLALLAVSMSGFPGDVIRYARNTNLTPWHRGETGQVILIDLAQKQVISLASYGGWRSPMRGVLPLNHTAEIVRAICQNVFTNGE
jgi:hypothetical protein